MCSKWSWTIFRCINCIFEDGVIRSFDRRGVEVPVTHRKAEKTSRLIIDSNLAWVGGEREVEEDGAGIAQGKSLILTPSSPLSDSTFHSGVVIHWLIHWCLFIILSSLYGFKAPSQHGKYFSHKCHLLCGEKTETERSWSYSKSVPALLVSNMQVIAFKFWLVFGVVVLALTLHFAAD